MMTKYISEKMELITVGGKNQNPLNANSALFLLLIFAYIQQILKFVFKIFDIYHIFYR